MKSGILALSVALAVALAQTPIPPNPPGPRGPANPQAGRQNQRPGMGIPPDGQALRAYLNLSETQVNDMRKAGEQARRQAEEKAKSLEPQIREKHAALDAAVAKGGDPTAIGKLILEIRAMEKQIHDARRAARDSFVNGLSAEQKTKFKAVEDAALLPQAAREAIAMGLVPGAQPPRQMQGPMQRPMHGPMQGPMQQRMQQGPNQGPRPGMQGHPGPMQGQPGQGQGRMMMRGGQPQPGQPGQPQQPRPQPQEEEE
jgi:hypothetical protein